MPELTVDVKRLNLGADWAGGGIEGHVEPSVKAFISDGLRLGYARLDFDQNGIAKVDLPATTGDLDELRYRLVVRFTKLPNQSPAPWHSGWFELTADTTFDALPTNPIAPAPDMRGPEGPQGEPGPQGPQGLPGPGAVPADEAVAAYVSTSGTETNSALAGPIEAGVAAQAVPGGSVVGQVKNREGGVQPVPLRAPTFTTSRSWPNPSCRFTPVWVDRANNAVYATARENELYKSTDKGVTFARRGALSNGLSRNLMLKLQSGTILYPTAQSPQRIRRSTDDGATSTEVFTMRSGTSLMGAQSWCEDPASGDVYMVEYQTTNTFSEIRVIRSTDDGATFSTFATLPGPTTSDPDKIAHIHSVQADTIGSGIYILAGDSEPAGGIYRVNAARDGIEPLILNRDIDTTDRGGGAAARAIGLMFFPNYIAWGADSSNAAVWRIPRAEFEAGDATNAERVYRLNSTAWFTIRAADDNTKWLISASNEGATTKIDAGTHLYAVEDDGATVYEVASAMSESSSWAALAPVGQAESSGDEVWLSAHGFDTSWVAMGRITYGTSPAIAKPAQPAVIDTWRTLNWGGEFTAQARPFGVIYVPSRARLLYIYDMGVRGLSGKTLYFRLWNENLAAAVAEVNSVWQASVRGQDNLQGAPHVLRLECTATHVLVPQIYQGGTPEAVTGAAHITYGFAPA